ncbi:MAG: DNA replication/repair protein RecF [Aphanocapsa feldmannii 277cV]|uniref:DNA replication and repair protein RecF n=2 Tax=Aphanocapsa feldmannii TaxID=192050 RepID=A0A524RLJ2_9CHRO|nr:MAG: DNA replication/repair protein RecF [Aphanocapsa feldmannii 277cV]TGH27329.1 MAG: DNA replication/repair protein RecF [Aphanocapsa feldmannii 277cI]
MKPVPLRLHALELQNFRNYGRARLHLRDTRLIVLGPNGTGKSNLLEAAELLGSLRSHRTSQDRDLIRDGEERARVCGRVGPDAEDTISLELRPRGGRRALRNGQPLERQHDLFGLLRCVGFSCLDLELVRGEPGLRRQWLDRVVLQLEPLYGDLLSRYGRLLRQRTALLRARDCQPDDAVLDAYDTQMTLVGIRLHRRRHRALQRLEPLASSLQQRLSGGREQLRLVYRPGTDTGSAGRADRLRVDGEVEEDAWSSAMLGQLRGQRQLERQLGSCRVGPQRDEVSLELNHTSARRYGSSGQQRCLVLALKLAELELITAVSGTRPLLILDDVLAELDPERQRLLLEAIGRDHQCLLSATHLDRFVEDWWEGAQCVQTRDGVLWDVSPAEAAKGEPGSRHG